MTHPSNFELEQFFSGESIAANIAEHIEMCEQCAAFIAQRKQDRDALLAIESPAVFMASVRAAIETHHAPVSKERFTLRIPAFAIAISAAVILCGIGYMLFPTNEKMSQELSLKRDTAETSSLRWKGGSPVIDIFIQRQAQIIRSTDSSINARIQPGDRVQYRITVPPGETGYAALIARENGKLEFVFPRHDNDAPLMVTNTYELPGTVEVTNDTVDLTLYLILQHHPIEANKLLADMNRRLQENGTIDTAPGVVNVQHIENNTKGY